MDLKTKLIFEFRVCALNKWLFWKQTGKSATGDKMAATSLFPFVPAGYDGRNNWISLPDKSHPRQIICPRKDFLPNNLPRPFSWRGSSLSSRIFSTILLGTSHTSHVQQFNNQSTVSECFPPFSRQGSFSAANALAPVSLIIKRVSRIYKKRLTTKLLI